MSWYHDVGIMITKTMTASNLTRFGILIPEWHFTNTSPYILMQEKA